MSVVRQHVMYCSQQYSDHPRQQVSDLEKIFRRASDREVRWVAGSEAGAEDFRKRITEAGNDFGYRVISHKMTDGWAAIRKHQTSSITRTYEQVLKVGDGVGHHGNRGVLGAHYRDLIVGDVTVLVGHYMTQPNIPVNLRLNKEYAQAIGRAARKFGVGRRLVFYAGDQNMIDERTDTFFGEPLTSTWDELKKWEGTGHGNIDVIASYDHDHRVKALYSRALNDREFRLHTDHYLVEAGFLINVREK